MAKVTSPLGGSDARGHFSKRMVFRRGGVVTRYHKPKDPKTPAQLSAREAFRNLVMSYLTREQADLIYALITHEHDDRYPLISHIHDHGALSGLGDDDHTQYYNQTRGDARYAQLSASDPFTQYLNQTRGDARYAQLSASDPFTQYYNQTRGDGRYLQIANYVSGRQMNQTHGNNGTVPAGATNYINPVVPGIQTGLAQMLTTEAITITTGGFKTNATQPASGSLVFTLLKNGVATALTFTVAANSAANFYSDSAHSVSLAAGDSYGWQVVNNASAASANIIAGALLLKF